MRRPRRLDLRLAMSQKEKLRSDDGDGDDEVLRVAVRDEEVVGPWEGPGRAGGVDEVEGGGLDVEGDGDGLVVRGDADSGEELKSVSTQLVQVRVLFARLSAGLHGYETWSQAKS